MSRKRESSQNQCDAEKNKFSSFDETGVSFVPRGTRAILY